MKQCELLFGEWAEAESGDNLTRMIEAVEEQVSDIRTNDKITGLGLEVQKEAFIGGFKTAMKLFVELGGAQ